MIIIIAEEKAPSFDEERFRRVISGIRSDLYSINKPFTPQQIMGLFTDRFYDKHNMGHFFFDSEKILYFPNLYMEHHRLGPIFVGSNLDKDFKDNSPCELKDFFLYAPPYDNTKDKATNTANAAIVRRSVDTINIAIERFCFVTHDVEELTQTLKSIHHEFVSKSNFFFKKYALKLCSDDHELLQQGIEYITNYTKPENLK